MNLLSPGGQRREIRPLLATAIFGAILLYLGITGMSAAT